jgi:hypothetical protein
LCFFVGTSFKIPERQHNTTQWDGPKYQHYSTHSARMQSYFTLPTDSKQKAENLSKTAFFYTGKKQFLNKGIFIVENTFFLKRFNVLIFL